VRFNNSIPFCRNFIYDFVIRIICILFAILPFKVIIRLAIYARHYVDQEKIRTFVTPKRIVPNTSHGLKVEDLQLSPPGSSLKRSIGYCFKIFFEHKVDSQIPWLLKSALSKSYFNDVIYFLIILNKPNFVIIHLARIDFSDTRPFFVHALNNFIERYSTGYVMEIAVRLHQIRWDIYDPGLKNTFENIMRRMLEHRLFEYEMRIFQHKQSNGELPTYVPTIVYIPHFYKNRQLITNLFQELNLAGLKKVLSSPALRNTHWEDLNDLDPLLNDLHLFYAIRDLTLYSYHNGEGDLVPLFSDKTIEIQRRIRPYIPSPSARLSEFLRNLGINNISEVKLLWPDWAALIGHNGHLNVHMMMQKLGWWDGKPLILAWKERVANPIFLDLFTDICPVLTLESNCPADIWHELATYIPFIGVSHQIFQFQQGPIKSGVSMYWNDAGAIALHQWESQSRGYPLREIYDRRFGDGSLVAIEFNGLRNKWGMSDSDWYVCLHMRDAGMRNEREGVGETVRNTSMENYIDAIRFITDRGGWVIRMGGPKVPPLPNMDRVVDYAISGEASPALDIHIVRMSRMFIGTTSGFAYVATSFGIPTAMVNAITSLGQIWTRNTRFALKLIRTSDGRLLTQRDLTSEKWRWTFPTYESLMAAGLQVAENSSDEILETVKETFVLTESSESFFTDNILETWTKSLSFPEYYGCSQPSLYFLKKYGKEFLPDDEAYGIDDFWKSRFNK